MTPSGYRCFHACERLYQYKYEQGIRPRKKAASLTFGTLVHVALEAWWKAHQRGWGNTALEKARVALYEARPENFDPYVFAAIDALIVGYDLMWGRHMSAIVVIAVEAEYRGPLHNPRTGVVADGFVSGGKIDILFSVNGTVYGMEHKTTSADISPGSAYWIGLRMDPQLSAYFDGAEFLGHELDSFFYDVIKKPTIKPYKATAEIKYTKGRKCGTRTKPCEGDACEQCGGSRWKEPARPRKGQRTADETVEEYRERLITEIGADPDKYYHRQRVVRLEDELDESRLDFWYTALRIGVFENTHKPRNMQACHRYGSTCAFWGVCTGSETLDSDKFERTGPHPELGIKA